MSEKITEGNIRKSAKNERPNYVTRYYLDSLKVAPLVTVRSAFCRCHSMTKNPQRIFVAAKQFAKAAIMPIVLES